MFQNEEFDLVCDTFKKSRVNVQIVSPSETIYDVMEEHVKPLFQGVYAEDIPIGKALGIIRPKTLYRFQDNLTLSYLAFLLPPNEGELLVVIGPYLKQPLSSEEVLEIGENNGFHPKDQKVINEYFFSVPLVPDGSALFLLLDSFCERMWKDTYEVIDVQREALLLEQMVAPKQGERELDDTFLDMKNIEKRYQMENEILDAVMFGSEHKVNQIFSIFTDNAFEKRVSDPVRNFKNYCIIMNTLLRKAAERGGVHPVYLDWMSSKFALEIERISAIDNAKDFMANMFRSYCKLVNKHSSKRYSKLVQQAVVAIEADPAAELNLHKIAEKLNVSNVYLSSMFKKETGKTITEYIREKRLSYAVYLLRSTNLQIQTIALHCGIVDVQYFSKLFKKHIGKTPTEFRAELNTINIF